jgi:hypothetical protein
MYCPQCDALKFPVAVITGALATRFDLPPDIIAARALAYAIALEAAIGHHHRAAGHSEPEPAPFISEPLFRADKPADWPAAAPAPSREP